MLRGEPLRDLLPNAHAFDELGQIALYAAITAFAAAGILLVCCCSATPTYAGFQHTAVLGRPTGQKGPGTADRTALVVARPVSDDGL